MHGPFRKIRGDEESSRRRKASERDVTQLRPFKVRTCTANKRLERATPFALPDAILAALGRQGLCVEASG